MRIYRWIILFILAGLTIVLLGTAVLAYQSPAASTPINSNQLDKRTAWQKEIPPAIDLIIEKSGIASVSAAQLLSHNFRVPEYSPDYLRLTRNGEEVPFYVQSSDQTTVLYFYAEAVTSTLTGPAVYRLSQEPGMAMPTRSAAPSATGVPEAWHEALWEDNTTFVADAAGDDHWLGPLLLAPGSLELPLDDIQPNGRAAELTVRLVSNNADSVSPDHHVELRLNGRFLTDYYWDGIQQKTVSLWLQPGQLSDENPNVLTIRVPGDTGAAGEAIYLDWVRLNYSGPIDVATGQSHFHTDVANVAIDSANENVLVFDVSDARRPVYLTNLHLTNQQLHLAAGHDGHQYVALEPGEAIHPILRAVPEWPQSLLAEGRGAAYLAVVADEPGFMAALDPLLQYRAAQGLPTTAVSLAQIYDEFSHGQQDPAAIRNFLAYAGQNWQPAPQFVLLVGNAAYDMRDAGSRSSLMPTYLVQGDNDQTFASDAWFVSFNHDDLPALSIGRFPVKNLDQLSALVKKTIAYEEALASASSSSWQKNVLLVADDEPAFDAASDNLETSLSAHGFQIHDLHMSNDENIHLDIVSALNKGVGLVNYVGFGDATRWGDEAVFRAQDTAMLANGDRLPVLTAFNCQSGTFGEGSEDSLAENLLWSPQGGVVAAIGPSARLYTNHSLPLVELFYDHLLASETRTLGAALLATQTAVANNEAQTTAVHTLNLLGDPALSLPKP